MVLRVLVAVFLDFFPEVLSTFHEIPVPLPRVYTEVASHNNQGPFLVNVLLVKYFSSPRSTMDSKDTYKKSVTTLQTVVLISLSVLLSCVYLRRRSRAMVSDFRQSILL